MEKINRVYWRASMQRDSAKLKNTIFFLVTTSLWVAGTPLASAQNAISFIDVSSKLEFQDIYFESWGAAWGDLNSDGYPDFYVGNHRNYGQMQVYNPLTERFDRANSADADGNWSTGFAHYDDHGASWADLDNDGDLDLLLNEARGSSRWLSNSNGILSTAVIAGQDGAFAWALESGGRDLTPDFTGKYFWAVLTDINHAGRLDRLLVDNDGNFPNSVSIQGGGPSVTLPTFKPVIDMIPGDFNGDLINDYITVVGRDRPNGSYLVDSNTIETNFSISTSSNNQELTIVTDGSLTLHEVTNDAWRGSSNDYSDVRIGSGEYAPSSDTFTLDVNDSANWGVSNTKSTNRLYVGYDTAAGAWKLRFNSKGSWEYLHFYMTTDAPIISFDQPSNNLGDSAAHPRLYLNTGSGFQNAGFSVGLDRVQCASGVAGDFDNDMDLDVYMACRTGAANIENVVFENNGDGSFTQRFDHGAEGIVGGSIVDLAGIADSAVLADYDIDGVLDILVVNGMHMRPLHIGGPKQLFKGIDNGNNWMEFDLIGTSSNRDGIGAKIYITTPDGNVQYREQNGGYHRWSQNHMRVHVGLGSNLTANVQVEWPTGIIDNYNGLQARNVFWLEESGNATVRFNRTDFDGDGDGVPDIQDAYPNDPNRSLPEVTVGDVTALEGIGDILVQVDLEVPAVVPGSVDYMTNDNTAVAGSDYTAVNGTLNFAIGENSQAVTLSILDDSDEEASEVFTFDLGNEVNLAVVDNQATINIIDDDTPASAECFEPSYDPATEQAVFLWKLCDGSGQWRLIVTGGGNGSSQYNGFIESIGGFDSFGPINFEASDLLDNTDPDQLSFILNVWNAGIDGLEWIPSANACLSVTPPPGVLVLLGEGKVQIDTPINLDTLAACQVVQPPSYCVAPNYDPATEQGVFVWQNCVTGVWEVRVTGGGSNVGIAYSGTVDSVGGFSYVTPFNFEANDVLDNTNPDALDYVLNVWNTGEDGFGFSTVNPAACLSALSPTVPLYLGVDRLMITGGALDLVTLQPCGTASCHP